MTVIALVGILAFAVLASGQQQYVDYDFQGQVLAPSSRALQSPGLPRAAAAQTKPTPVPIIKQINRHNDDGSYTYGYEGADGSFKIETKLPTGEVTGKYGYVDDAGKLRVVDYGANRYGFQPAGEGITVAPPTLVDETTDRTKQNVFAEYDDESLIYAKPQPQPIARPVPSRQPKRPRLPPQQQPFAPEPQFIAYESQPRTPSPLSLPSPAPAPAPAPNPSPIQHFQQIPQQVPPSFGQTLITYDSQPRPAVPTPRVSSAPALPRVAVASSAVPSGPLFRPNALPAPIAAPVRPAPVREAPVRSAGPSGSVLDQLIQQFALPQGVGQPLHDISFGSYSSQTRF